MPQHLPILCIHTVTMWQMQWSCSKVLFTRQHDSTMSMINGAKQHNYAQLSLQSLCTCHVVRIQSWLIAWLQEVVDQSWCPSHALAKHLASACSSVLKNKSINHLAGTMWPLLASKKVCLFVHPNIRQAVVISYEQARGDHILEYG